ncbi:hypothetical protein CEE44_00115 [Candidatus Woesearchaeota archaeon B3_Woes]|nr:MAG: hypothetical protein CEE44_00115 [Candidatus Woesearchaeota archaeon B3_Woes]
MKHNGEVYVEMPDKVLIAAFKEGDERAYSELYHRYEPRLTGFIFRFENGFKGAVEVGDIVQQTFTKLYTRAQLYNEQTAEFGTWLFTIAANLAKTELRNLKRRKTCSLDGMWEDIRNDFSVDDVLYGGNLTMELELSAKVDSAMQRLIGFFDENRALSTAYVLRSLQGLKYQTIADIMDIPLGTVKSRVHRARKYLRNGSL